MVSSPHGAVLADKPRAWLATSPNRRSCMLGKPRWCGCNGGVGVQFPGSIQSKRIGLRLQCWATRKRASDSSRPLPFRKIWEGCWERYNFFPTGGRQHIGDDMSSNELTQGDDLSGTFARGLGAVALSGASSAGRRIAQASNGKEELCCGVDSFAQGQAIGISGQNRMDTFGPLRSVDNRQAGKPRVRNICAAKGSLGADCTAKFAWMLTGLYHCESSRKKWITWEAAGYTSNTRVLSGRPGVGAADTRFKQVERKLFRKPCVLVVKLRLGRKLPSVKDATSVHLGMSARTTRRMQRRAPGRKGLAPRALAHLTE